MLPQVPDLGLELGRVVELTPVEADLGIEELRDRAPRLGALGDGAELFLVNAGHARDEAEIAIRATLQTATLALS